MRRTPPYAHEAEIAVLGAMLCSPDAVPKALEILTGADFYSRRHRLVFDAMAAMFAHGHPIEPVALREELDRNGELEDAGGLAFIAECMDAVVSGAQVEYHAGLVRDRASRRALITAGEEIARIGQSNGPHAETLLAKAQEVLFQVTNRTRIGGFRWMKDLLYPVFEQVEAIQKGDRAAIGLSTGLADVDEMIGGLKKGELTVLAARPSMGKTAMAMTVGANVAIQQQQAVAVFSMEMSKEQLVQRMLCSEALVDLGRLLRGRLTDDDYVRLAQAAGHLNTAPLYIDDTSGISPLEIRAKARRLASEQEVGLFVIDYLGLIRGSEGDNQHQVVGNICRDMKEMAKELAVPVLLLCQLSRKPEERSDKRPILSDLRDSGNIEEHADNVWMLYRPEYYFPDKAQPGEAEMIVPKQRNGPTGSVPLFFRKECARYESAGQWGVRAA